MGTGTHQSPYCERFCSSLRWLPGTRCTHRRQSFITFLLDGASTNSIPTSETKETFV